MQLMILFNIYIVLNNNLIFLLAIIYPTLAILLIFEIKFLAIILNI
jgi:hypothetical protein